jgi:preprotein translocase subunit YajC
LNYLFVLFPFALLFFLFYFVLSRNLQAALL